MKPSEHIIFKFLVVCGLLIGISSNRLALAEKSFVAQADSLNLFESTDMLDLTLEGDIDALMKGRNKRPSYQPMKLYYKSTANESVAGALDLRVRVRGNFRRLKKNCERPPLKFNFKKKEVPEYSLFRGQSELKLVVPCQGEQYVIKEYLVYKALNLMSDYTFRVRPVRLSYRDVNDKTSSDPEFGFLIEDEDKMAARNFAEPYKKENLRPENLHQEAFFRMSVFHYMIGNTDWSIQYRHNVKIMLLKDQRMYVPVPYDFDITGIVSAPYAKPAKELKLSSVRERVYRGYCLDNLDKLNPVLEQFQKQKPELYAVFSDSELLDKRSKDATVEYLDEFYEIIGNPEKRSKAFSYPCEKNGTGNIVISGFRDG